jgi:hypothetical protein
MTLDPMLLAWRVMQDTILEVYITPGKNTTGAQAFLRPNELTFGDSMEKSP